MGFKDWVERNVVSFGPPGPPPGPEIDTADVTLRSAGPVRDLALDVDQGALQKVPPADASFEKIFEAAKIPVPAHKYSVEKVGAMLGNPKLASLSKEARAAAVLVALEAQGVRVQEIVEEAARKDRALDVFEKVKRDHLERTRAEKEEANRKLQAEIEKNLSAVAQLEAQVSAWIEAKARKEVELHEILAHFTTENPITLSGLKPEPAKVKITDLTQPDAPP